MQLCNLATLQLCNFATLRHCNIATLPLCNFATLLFCNIGGRSARHTNWTDQLDKPAGQTSWTDQLDGRLTDQLDRSVGWISWKNKFSLFEALASLHIQRLTSVCTLLQLLSPMKALFYQLSHFPGSKRSQIHNKHISASLPSIPVKITWACTRHVLT